MEVNPNIIAVTVVDASAPQPEPEPIAEKPPKEPTGSKGAANVNP